MIRLTSITTKTGDNGTTGLGDGTRRAKSDIRIEAYGTVDETNSALGVARALFHQNNNAESIELTNILARLQNDLFNLGADLCQPNLTKPSLRIEEADIVSLEKEGERLNKDLPSLDSFVLPFGTVAVAALHLARTIARRAERQIVLLTAKEEINPKSLKYMNRLSDLLFIMARFASQGVEEKWQPKK